MDKVRFEAAMSKFFDKAGVRLLKKGEDYDADEKSPSYILLDLKRKSFYLAETDVRDEEAENNAAAGFSAASSLNDVCSRAVMGLGGAINGYSDTFTINSGEDLSSLTRKSSLIISDENGKSVSDYLSAQGISFQSVPSKDAFLVMFFDAAASDKIVSICQEYDNGEGDAAIIPDTDTADGAEGDTEAEAAAADEDAAPAGAAPDDIAPAAPEESAADDELHPDEEEMLDNIDLSDLLKPKEAEEEPKDEAEATVLYSKLLKEEMEKIEVSDTAPVEKSLDDVPDGIIDEEMLKEMSSDGDSDNVKSKGKSDKKKDKKEKAVKEKKKAATEKSETPKRERRFLDIPGVLCANIIGILFFLPAYILNKLFKRFLPPFVIYWLASMAAVFGLYQTVFSFVPIPYDMFIEPANNAVHAMSTVSATAEGKEASPAELVSSEMIRQGAVMFYGELHIAEFLKSGWLLHYLSAFAAVLMIIPAFRRIGKTLTVFSLLSYIALPFAVFAQARIIEYAFSADDLNLTAALIYFTICFLPVIFAFLNIYFSSALIPDEDKHREVIP